MASADLRAELDCSICLSLYTDPVSLRCGHNFCRSCIVSALDAQEAAGVYSCPDCRAEDLERPALEKNRKLRNIVEHFLTAQPDMKETGIFCTYCTKSPAPAVRTCLQCELSMCLEHLEAHNKSVNHSLIEPTVSFLHRKCSTHNEILKYYCPMDTACICVSCWVAGDHKGHDVELLDVASEKEKEKMRSLIERLKFERVEAARRIQGLKDYQEEQEEKSTRLAEKVTGLFTDIKKKLEDLEKRIQGEIARQKEQVSLSVFDLVRQVELQKEELTKKINQIEGLCIMTDPLVLLQEDLKTCDISDWTCDVISDRRCDVSDSHCLDEDLVSQILHRGLLSFADNLIDLKIKRQFPVMEKSDVLLDIDTAHNKINISQDLRSASYTATPENRPDGPKRFKSVQVLSSTSFSSGRHYWEVDVSRVEKWIIGVAEESLERKVNGNESFIGYNEKSWGLELIKSLGAHYNKIFKRIVSVSPVKVVGVYLDYEAGRLSFYQLCDPVRHLHTFITTFSETLYAAFYLFENSSIRIMR